MLGSVKEPMRLSWKEEGLTIKASQSPQYLLIDAD